MQVKNQRSIHKRWKIAAGVGTAAALGVTGIAFAGPGDVAGVPAPITLQSQVTAAEPTAPSAALWATTTTSTEAPFLSPGTTLRMTANTGEATPLSASTTLPTSTATSQTTESDCADDSPCADCPDDAQGGPCVDSADVATDDSSPDSPDVATDDSSPDSPDVTVDDADSSIDS